MFSQLLQDFIVRERLPAAYAEDARGILLPLAERLLAQADTRSGTFLLGINGAQGTGKSTLTALFSELFASRGRRVAELSIDDFYLGKTERATLGRQSHPLLHTRGVPGTHDVPLLRQTLNSLCNAGVGERIALPRFDKARDDRVAAANWPRLEGPIDLVILEGWFVGTAAEDAAALTTPVNELEAGEDVDGRWRELVNQALATDYAAVFRRLDYLILLQAPSFEQVFEWRSLQEQKLRQRSPADAPGIMDAAALGRFIQHFERLTRHGLTTLPETADAVLRIDSQHRFVDCRFRQPG